MTCRCKRTSQPLLWAMHANVTGWMIRQLAWPPVVVVSATFSYKT